LEDYPGNIYFKRLDKKELEKVGLHLGGTVVWR